MSDPPSKDCRWHRTGSWNDVGKGQHGGVHRCFEHGEKIRGEYKTPSGRCSVGRRVALFLVVGVLLVLLMLVGLYVLSMGATRFGVLSP